MTDHVPTPLEPAAPSLSGGRTVLLKREDVHELGAFKWRGALPALAGYRERGVETVVTASTGNHGAATAWAAQRLGLKATVYAPEGATRAKVALIEQFGAEIRLVGTDFDEAKDEGHRHAREHGLPFFEDGAEMPAVVVPVGNGALLGGLGLRICDRAPDTLRIGVAAKDAPVMAESWEAGGIVESDRGTTFADGLAVRVAIPLAVDVLGEVASRMLLVSEREMARAVRAYDAAGIRAEGAAAAALAALPQLDDVDGAIVLIVTGRNIDDKLHRRACEDPESFPA
jgi:threonine dehydratase